MHTKALLLTGDIKLLTEGNEEEALSAYERAILSCPSSTQALGSKAYVLDILGRYEEAFENLDDTTIQTLELYFDKFKNI